MNPGKPACEHCGRHDLRFRTDATYFCRLCGFDSKGGTSAVDSGFDNHAEGKRS
jgi:ribosomal protein L37AE/L43A